MKCYTCRVSNTRFIYIYHAFTFISHIHILNISINLYCMDTIFRHNPYYIPHHHKWTTTNW